MLRRAPLNTLAAADRLAVLQVPPRLAAGFAADGLAAPRPMRLTETVRLAKPELLPQAALLAKPTPVDVPAAAREDVPQIAAA